MNGFAFRFRLLAVLLGIALCCGNLLPVASAESLPVPQRSTNSAIRVTPPAPVFNDAERVAELRARRARVAQWVGSSGMLIFFSAEPKIYTNDVDYEYRQENNLYYLTHLKQKGATLVLMPGNSQTPEILFLPRRDPAAETWTGYMYSPEQARAISGVNEIWEAREFEPFIRSIRARQAYRPKEGALLFSTQAAGVSQPVAPPVPQSPQTVEAARAAIPARPVTRETAPNPTTQNPSSVQPAATAAQPSVVASTQATSTSGFETLFAAMAQNQGQLFLLLPRGADNREFRQEQEFAAQWVRSASGLNVASAWPIFVEMRLVKSPSELRLLQHAIDITIEALGRSMAVIGRVKWEYEVEAEVEYTFKRRNADFWGYPSIVGCGRNATTLHYNESQGPITPGDLILMDVGAEYGHYTADITRTFPVNGKFTPAQAEIYNIVFDAQEAVARATKPGASLREVHNVAVEVIKKGLLKVGLITDVNSDQYRIWFMHGTSHWLGMNVHDVGTRDTVFKPGMVFTNEPGIYVRQDALDYLPKTAENEKFIAAVRPAFEKYKNIGVRIEDDMLVTETGTRWMTEALPRSIADIEAFMARASGQWPVVGGQMAVARGQ